MHDSSVSKPHQSHGWKRDVRNGLRVAGFMLLWVMAAFLLGGAAVHLGLLSNDGPSLIPGNRLSGAVELMLGLAILILTANQWMKAISGLTLMALVKALVSAANGRTFPSGTPTQSSLMLIWALYCGLTAALSWRFMFSKPGKADKAAAIVMVVSTLSGALNPYYLAPGLLAMFAAWVWSKRREHERRTPAEPGQS